jgi:hypothetical protein
MHTHHVDSSVSRAVGHFRSSFYQQNADDEKANTLLQKCNRYMPFSETIFESFLKP